MDGRKITRRDFLSGASVFGAGACFWPSALIMNVKPDLPITFSAGNWRMVAGLYMKGGRAISAPLSRPILPSNWPAGTRPRHR